jgi:hypothetical protein
VTLTHYSARPLTLDRDRAYVQSAGNMKPAGLWLSVDGDDDWPTWCRGEEFRIESLTHLTQFRLVPDARVLWLSMPDEVVEFHGKYAGELTREFLWIDWPRVAADWDGLVIAPYQWSLRFDPRVPWYYGWDCASGCVWNPAVLTVEDLP